MIKVIEKKEVPRAKIACSNCKSILEYGNSDLSEDYERTTKEKSTFYATHYSPKYWCFRCPVCGCKVSANWI